MLYSFDNAKWAVQGEAFVPGESIFMGRRTGKIERR